MATLFTNISVTDTVSANNITCNTIQVNQTDFVGTDILTNGALHTDNIVNNTSNTINIVSPIVNIGQPGITGTVNILGALNYISTDQLQVKDPLITLNKGAISNDVGCGIEIENNGAITQHIKTYGSVSGATGWEFSGAIRANAISCASIGCTGPVSMTTITASSNASITGNLTALSNFSAGNIDGRVHAIRGNLNINTNAGATGAVNINTGTSTGAVNIGATGNTTTLNGKWIMPSNVNNRLWLGTESTLNLADGVPLAIRNITNSDITVNGTIGSTGVYPQYSYGARNWTWAQDVTNDSLMYFGCANATGSDPDFEYVFKRGGGLKIQPNPGLTGTDFTEALNVVGNGAVSGNLSVGGSINAGTFNLANITVGTITFDRALGTPTTTSQLGDIVTSGWQTNAAATTSRAVRNVTSITLPAGVWKIDANCSWSFGTGILATGNQMAFMITSTSNTADPYSFFNTDSTITMRGWDRLDTGSSVVIFDNVKGFFSIIRDLTASTTFYLNGTGGNSTNSAVTTYAGQLTAVRIG